MGKPNSKKLLTYLKEIQKQNEINSYYKAAMDDHNIGHPISFLKQMLLEMEDEEDYLACAGICKAIKEIENNSE